MLVTSNVILELAKVLACIGESSVAELARVHWTFANGESMICENPIGEVPATHVTHLVLLCECTRNCNRKIVPYLTREACWKEKTKVFLSILYDVMKKLKSLFNKQSRASLSPLFFCLS